MFYVAWHVRLAQYYKNDTEQQEKNHCRDISDIPQQEHRESKDVHPTKPRKKHHNDYDEDYSPNSKSKKSKHKKRSHSKSRKRSLSKSHKHEYYCESDSKRSKSDSVKTESCKSDSSLKSESLKNEAVKDSSKYQVSSANERTGTMVEHHVMNVNCKTVKQAAATNSQQSAQHCLGSNTVSVSVPVPGDSAPSNSHTPANVHSPIKKPLSNDKQSCTPNKVSPNKSSLTPKKSPKKELKPPVDLLDQIMRGMDGKNWN